MPFDIDVPVGGGSAGPFVQWNASETKDGSMPGRTWALRDADGRKAFEAFARGVVMDVKAIKTGWCWSNGAKGTAPEWQWNASIKKFAPEPLARGADRWKRGFAIPLAYGPNPDDFAIWEQAQGGAWQGFVQLVGLLKEAGEQGNKLPVVVQDGSEKIETKKGITHAPKFKIMKWVPRPAALAEEVVDTGGDAPF